MTAVSGVLGDLAVVLADRDAVHDERNAIAAAIKDIADDDRFATRRAELSALSEAIAAGGNRRAIWRGIQLEHTFRPDTTIQLPPRRRRRLAGVFGALAAVAVFLPVWWTWVALQDASRAYEVILDAGRAQGQSFLQLWTTGFLGELPDFHRLPTVALWSVVFIVLCVLLIVAERVTVRSAEIAEDAEYRECSARLAAAMNLAQISINSHNADDPLQGADIISEAIEHLLAAHKQTRRTATSLRAVAERVEAATAKVAADLEGSSASLLTTFRQGVDEVLSALGAVVDGTANSLAGSIGTAASSLSQSVAQATAALETSVSSAVDSLNVSVGHVAQASSGMQQAAVTAASAQQTLADAAAGLANGTVLLDERLRQQIEAASSAISRAVDGLTSEAGAIKESTTEVGTALGDYTSALQHQITELTQIRASLERISGLRGTSPIAATVG